MSDVYIVSAVRTPLASFQGSLAPMKATSLGAVVVKAACERAGVGFTDVDGVIMGCVLQAGLGQAPARQAMVEAGLPKSVGAFTVNKVCSSGLLAVMLAGKMIRFGDGTIYVAGGMESMSNSPYLLLKARQGLRMGDAKLVDSMVFDGLWDIYTDQHMGLCAELCAEKYSLSREQQDAYAMQSYKRAQAAINSGAFKEEIVPVVVPQKKGELVFDTDEEPGRADFDKMKALKPSFKKDGTVTAANASSISDGAAALLLASGVAVKGMGLKPLARIVAFAEHSHEPEWFTTAPIYAVKNVLNKAGMRISDIGLFEINEAFSAVAMAAMRELNLDASAVNINGGAVALGHPIGASGARILVTLVHAMRARSVKYGVAALCNGGGEATAVLVESV